MDLGSQIGGRYLRHHHCRYNRNIRRTNPKFFRNVEIGLEAETI